MTTFKDLSIGDLFILTGVHTPTVVFKKTMEDGEHNAVWHDADHIGESIPDDMPVAMVAQVKENTAVSDLSQCGDACNCIGCRASAIVNQPKPVLDTPRYMFAERPVTPSTWIDLQNMQLDTYMLVKRTGLLVDPVTREYCYVYWDAADQCSNPYATQAEAVSAKILYVSSL